MTAKADKNDKETRTKNFSEFVRELREKRDWSLRDVQQKTAGKVSAAYLSQIERGERNIPHLEIVQELAKVYETPLESFLKIAGFLMATSTREPNDDYYQRRAERLSPANRELLDRLISALLEHQEKFGS
jgi:transcriptional regulator with XRE-family HTH domain